MKKTPLFLLLALALANLLTVQHAAFANPAESATAGATAATADATLPDSQPKERLQKKKALKAKDDIQARDDTQARDNTQAKDDAQAKGEDKTGKAERDNTLFSVGHDLTLAAGEHATAVVSVLASSTSAGDVDQAVVSVLGDTRVTGPVGEVAVAVLGSTFVDSHVGANVVAVFGDVELGPHAEVGGDVVAVGGELRRDPGAIVHGNVQNVMLFGSVGHLDWLRSWVQHCFLYARPLAFAPHLGWAWTLAFSFLAIYLLIAVLFPAGVNRCVRTMEEQPGRTVLAALLTFLLKPIVFLLVLVTVIGAFLLPFLAFALFIAGLFGKAVMLAWIGRRIIPYRDAEHPPLPLLAVLVGGLVVVLLYTVPVFGFIAYKMLGILGLGIVVYTLLIGFRSSRSGDATPGAAAATVAASSAAPAGSAGTAAPAAAEAPYGADAAAASAAPEQAQSATAPPAPPLARPISIALDNRVGFWHRALALLLDVILVGILCLFVNFSFHEFILLLASYGAVMWKLRGTTIGGIICNLRVVRLDGRPIDWPTAIVRALGCFLSAAVAGLGFIWVVFDPERQSWHDKIAGTVVVRTPRGTALL
jgi:uncharacterized RDD family membrane protein YckC